MSPGPSRRDLLTGGPSKFATEEHISSLVVHVRPEHRAGFGAALAAMPGIEVHAETGGKVVLTLETRSESDIVERLAVLSALPGVLSAALVFHHVETDVPLAT
ncbi:nitrate reductase [Rhodoplanes serenus]|uniref:Chaperone NapD n=1 Tax=Rhodoplanes serenus TaxID=200615 RepID=A0A9X4XRZ3_9BRAD|nr:chaperone NapD [Rhodoplanes serenus]MTW19311.1 nitrate reductase [Rhodoplanes serenus]